MLDIAKLALHLLDGALVASILADVIAVQSWSVNESIQPANSRWSLLPDLDGLASTSRAELDDNVQGYRLGSRLEMGKVVRQKGAHTKGRL